MKLKKVLAAASLALFASQGFSADADLDLTVSGEIFAAPTWNDGTADVTSVDFDFTAYAQATAAADVDSATQTMTLNDAQNTASALTVALTRPTGCTIGATSVLDANVHFMDAGAAVTTDTTVTFTEGAGKVIGIRFAAAGNHGQDAGTVACSGDGLLRYTY